MIDRFIPGRAELVFGTKLVRRPDRVVRRASSLVAELGRVAVGASSVEPSRGDRRFAGEEWQDSPMWSRLAKAYLAAGGTIDGLVSDARLSVQDERRVRFALENLVDAAAPSNFLLTNPVALDATVSEKGANLVRGARNFVRDMSEAPRLPSSVDGSSFEVGVDVAATPGAVVLRTELFELLHYAPQTTHVREAPVLLVPPMVNKYYLVDLAPDRSLVEHLVRQGQQVFAMSWRNPSAAESAWDLDTYAAGAVEAMDAALAITGSDRIHLGGNCSGGTMVAALASRLEARGEAGKLAGIMLGVTVIDAREAGTASAFMGPELARLAVAAVDRRGILDGASLQSFFAWLRPNDLVWNYVVNNYLLGRTPPAFDLLFWNADTTNMAAGLLRDLADMAVNNSMACPGEMSVLGDPVDLGAVKSDAYIVAGTADHITPWENCYATTQMLGGDVRFVLSNAGHVAALVNPPGNPKARFAVSSSGSCPASASEWRSDADEVVGTWWNDWCAWLADRSGSLKRAPRACGSKAFPVLGPAPGEYVRG